MSKVQIQIVTSNHRSRLKRLFEALREQTFKDLSIVMIDNASKDGSAEYVREQFPEVMTLKNTNNLGTAAAHNQGLRLALSKWPEAEWGSRYVLVLNPEVVPTRTFLADLVREAEARPEAGELGGRVMKLFDAAGEDRELEQFDATHVLDSAGLVRFPNGRIVARGEGALDENQFESGEIFGATGAVLVRASALASVREGEEYFDASFFSFGEDIDLAWRLQNAGWKARYVPSAVANRYCGSGSAEKISIFKRLRNRFSTSTFVGFHSYRNHLLTMTKNMRFGEFFGRMHRIVPQEFLHACSMLLFEPLVFFRAIGSYLGLLPRTLRKRARMLVRK